MYQVAIDIAEFSILVFSIIQILLICFYFIKMLLNFFFYFDFLDYNSCQFHDAISADFGTAYGARIIFPNIFNAEPRFRIFLQGTHRPPSVLGLPLGKYETSARR